MKYIYLILISSICTGCVCYDSNGNVVRASIFRTMDTDDIYDLNFERLSNLSVGLTKEQTLKIMGTETYSCYHGIIDNPDSTEIIVENDRTFEVLYYTTFMGNNGASKDDCPPEEEYKQQQDGTLVLVVDTFILGFYSPLVFEDGKLIGWGKCFLRNISKEYDSRFTNRGINHAT